MKTKIMMIVVGLMMSLTIFAQSSIARDFPVGTLGVTTQDAFLQRMRVMGAEQIQTGEEGFLTFAGDFQIQNCPMNVCNAVFENDRLTMIMFINGNSQQETNQKLTESLKRQYAYVGRDGAEDAIINAIIQEAFSAVSNQSAEIWSRRDANTIIVYVQTSEAFMLIYGDYELIQESIMRATKDDPDFDEANAVRGVAGVQFGAEKREVRASLVNKYGTPLKEGEHELYFADITLGGKKYDYATFYFAYNPQSKRNELIAAEFVDSFDKWQDEEALRCFEGITRQYAAKYTNEKKHQNDRLEKANSYGMLEMGYDYYPIYIRLNKSLSQGGEIRFYVNVSYYLNKTQTLYNDDI